MRGPQAPPSRRVIARTTRGAAETEAVGERIGRRLVAGDVLLLVGDLGAGKTTFTRGLARGMGVSQQVKSPTFAIHLRYPGRLAFHHIDLYRIADPKDLGELGFEDLLGREGVVVVEWGERLGEHAPPGALTVRFEDLGGDLRRLLLSGPRAEMLRVTEDGGWENVAGGENVT